MEAQDRSLPGMPHRAMHPQRVLPAANVPDESPDTPRCTCWGIPSYTPRPSESRSVFPTRLT